MLGAAHKPGAMPLRPLGLGDIYDAAFRIIRFNPKATVGSAVLVAAAGMSLPLLFAAVFTWTVGLSLEPTGSDFGTAELAGLIGFVSALVIGVVMQWIGTILVTGMIAHVTAAAAIGRRLSLQEAWLATRGKRWRLIGTSLLIGLVTAALFAAYVGLWIVVVVTSDTATPVVIWGLLTVPVFICLTLWLWIRAAYLPVPALMLEPVGILGAVGRGFGLSRRQFWRIFGIALLTLLITLVLVTAPDNPAGIATLEDLDGATWVRCADDVPCGRVALAVLEDAGVTAEPVSLEEDVRATLDKVVSGEADAGLVYASDAVAADGDVSAIPIDGAEVQPTSYLIAELQQSEDGDLAGDWIDLVTGPDGRAALTDAGFTLP
jgi:hypothetical protein